MIRGEGGAVLLEVIVALALITTAGLASIEVLGAAVQEIGALDAKEQHQAKAQRLLLSYSLMSRRQLDQRIGSQDAQEMFIRVARPQRELYRVAVGDLQYPNFEMLVTVLFRPVGQP